MLPEPTWGKYSIHETKSAIQWIGPNIFTQSGEVLGRLLLLLPIQEPARDLSDAEPDTPTYQNYGAAHASSSDSRRRAVALGK